ncbi:hypothetical protein [Sphingosinicella sp. BN140058]|nr:hypothetical protein [Sphingosinicella sp. BN140058]
MKALVWSGIVQGFSVPPPLLLMMLLTNSRKVVGAAAMGASPTSWDGRRR